MKANDGMSSKSDRLLEALEELFSNVSMDAWLITPNPMFDGQKPRDLLQQEKDDRLWQMVFELRSGAHV
jgi:uncharacterized protein (DUF2384 family)